MFHPAGALLSFPWPSPFLQSMEGKGPNLALKHAEDGVRVDGIGAFSIGLPKDLHQSQWVLASQQASQGTKVSRSARELCLPD